MKYLTEMNCNFQSGRGQNNSGGSFRENPSDARAYHQQCREEETWDKTQQIDQTLPDFQCLRPFKQRREKENRRNVPKISKTELTIILIVYLKRKRLKRL